MKKLVYVFLVILVGGFLTAATAPKKPNKKIILDAEKKVMYVKKSFVEADSAAVAALLPSGFTMEIKPK
ncbi:MAG: hypothetical protein WC011_03825 [Candidatus Paceibacterota bacterium]